MFNKLSIWYLRFRKWRITKNSRVSDFPFQIAYAEYREDKDYRYPKVKKIAEFDLEADGKKRHYLIFQPRLTK